MARDLSCKTKNPAAKQAALQCFQALESEVSNRMPVKVMPSDAEFAADPSLAKKIETANACSSSFSTLQGAVSTKLLKVNAAQATLSKSFRHSYEMAKSCAAQIAQLDFSGCHTAPDSPTVTAWSLGPPVDGPAQIKKGLAGYAKAYVDAYDKLSAALENRASYLQGVTTSLTQAAGADGSRCASMK